MKHEKIAPGLLLALRDYENQGSAGLLRHRSIMGVLPTAPLATIAESPPPIAPPTPAVAVFVRGDKDVDLGDLSGEGVLINRPGDRPPTSDDHDQLDEQVVTGFVPLERIGALSEHPGVRQIVPSRRLRPLMDVAPGAVNLPAFRSRTGLTGRDTIIGVVDTGIDPRHPAFSGRIISIWDQTKNGTGVPGAPYGRELTGGHLVLSRDTEGHGTHVASIAGGSGAAFGGVAPEAQFVIVKSDLQDARIADGVRYIFAVAARENKPAVVNLSVGGHFDPHDGSDPLSAVIDGESASGRIVCCAAGNEGNDNIHGQADIPPGGLHDMRFRAPPVVSAAQLNGWYGSATQLEVAVRTPGGFVTPFQPVLHAGPPVRRYELSDAVVEIATPGPNPDNGDHQFLVDLTPTARATVFSGSVWRLLLRNAGDTQVTVDVWTLDDQPSPQVVFSGTSARDSMKIGSPGCAGAAVTVASYTTKVAWTDFGGAPQAVGLAPHDISDFSSEGPLRNGASKPDVAAPGAMIVAALSQAYAPDPSSVVDPDHVVMSGTSMAAPFITGVVALLLQQDPNLDATGVKRFLRAHSAVPGRGAGVFDPKWGFGLVRLP